MGMNITFWRAKQDESLWGPLSFCGERFDALHPLMFGSASTCSEIATAIGDGARLYPAQQPTGVSAVRLSGEGIGLQAAQRASRYILLTPVVADRGEPGAVANAGWVDSSPRPFE
jgi:hypothetical protein